MQQASLGLNCVGPSPMEARADKTDLGTDNSALRKDVVVKSEIPTTEGEQSPCTAEAKLKIKQEAPEEEVPSQELHPRADGARVGHEHRDYRAERHNRLAVDYRNETINAPAANVSPTVSSTLAGKHNSDSIDFSRLSSQQYASIQHPAYRSVVPSVSVGSNNAFGFSHFYGPQQAPPPVSGAQATPGFANVRSLEPAKRPRDPNDRNIEAIDSIDDAVAAYRQNAAGMLNEAFLRDYRMEMNDFHQHGKPAGFTGGPSYPAAAFRPSLAQAYAHHHQQNNNSAYRGQQQHFAGNIGTGRQKNKWNSGSTGGRGLHHPSSTAPTTSVSFFRTIAVRL